MSGKLSLQHLKDLVGLDSHDASTPFIYKCKNTVGCSYTTTRSDYYTLHLKCCNEDLVQRQISVESFPCLINRCTSILQAKCYLTAYMLNTYNTFNWTPKSCKYGCKLLKVYTNLHTYQKHQNAYHTLTCTFAGCTTPERQFKSELDLSNHLEEAHDLIDDEDKDSYMYSHKLKI